MSILDLTADEAVRASINRGPTQPYVPPKRSAWGGALTAVPRAVGVAAGEVGANIADTFGALRQIRDTPYERGQSSWGDVRLRSDLGDTVRDYWADYRPDPATASTAEKLLFGFARGMTTLIPATVAAGPAGAFAAGLNEWMTVATDLQAQGVDRETALKAGLVQGAGMASAALPLLGQTLPQTAALYVAGGPGGFMAQQALTRKILENAGQNEIAASYDPFDPVGLTVAAALPGFFTYRGIKGQQAAAKAAKIAQAVKAEADFQAGPLPSEPTPVAMASREVIDAAMVQNLRDHAAQIDTSKPASSLAGTDQIMAPTVRATANLGEAMPTPRDDTAGAIGRMAALEREAADFPVRLDQDGQPVRFADDLAEVRRLAADGTDDTLGTLDADLLRVAVECAISGG